MCGFAGVIAWDDNYRTSRETLARMSAAVAHRGPDGEGAWFNHEGEVTPDRPQAALAFRRLAIIDLDPRANQPMTDGHGRWIVFNGEIYNYRELRKELSSLDPHYEWKTQGDTEVLLRSYAQWGEKCVEHLNGMFAFAVWDENTKELYLARDRMGQKPLYVAKPYCSNSCPALAFASELPALRELTWFNNAINDEAIVSYLRWGYIGDEWTAYRLADKVAPALWRRARSITSTHEGDLYFHPNDVPPRSDDPVRQTRETVLNAVRRQLVADVPVGCFLSGGIDSSVVASAMKTVAPVGQRLLTFSIGFDDARYDETAFSRQVAEHLGTDHRSFIVRPHAAEDLPRLAAVFGEPFGDSSALPTHYLARETRGHVKVALSGDGGDELFGGYDRYRAMKLERLLTRFPKWSRGIFAGTVMEQLPASHPKSVASKIGRFLRTLDLPAEHRYASYMRLFSDELLKQMLSDGFRQSDPSPDQVADTFAFYRKERDVVQAALAVDRISYLPDDLLTKVDRASMLHALEVRSPFMDHELVQFAAGLTTDQLLKGGPKRMLREAFAKDLPDFVFKRKKMGFAVPIGEWMRNELRPMLHDHLFAADSFASAHFNRKVVERLVAEHQEQRVDHSQRLYALLMLELWWRIEKNR